MEAHLTALLAGIAGGRRYWVRAPQTAQRPFVVLNRVDGTHNYNYAGPSGYVASRVQLDVYADSYQATKSVTTDIKSLLSGFSDEDFQAIFIESERDLPAADAGDVTNLFRTSIDIIVHHGE